MTTAELLKTLSENPFLLAPMAGITDSPFRSFMREMGCGIVTTELISAKSLQLGNEKSKKLMHFSNQQRPVGVQLFGEELSSLSYSASLAEQAGADFVDLNCGCPVSKIVKKGAGSAILKDLKVFRAVLKTLKSAVSIPVSVKIRTGWDEQSRNAVTAAGIAREEGMVWLSIHGRTRSQGYSGQADWNYIEEVKKNSRIPVIGNGDLIKAEQILELKQKTGCDGMMIGRGCLKNPWIFLEIKQKKPVEKNYIQILQRLRWYLENFYEEKMFLLQYKKFCAWYSSGFPESAQFRKAVFQTRQKQEVLELVNDYFSRIDIQLKKDEAYSAELLQGHG